MSTRADDDEPPRPFADVRVCASDGDVMVLPADVAARCRFFDETYATGRLDDDAEPMLVPFTPAELRAFVRAQRLIAVCNATDALSDEYAIEYTLRRALGGAYARAALAAEFLNAERMRCNGDDGVPFAMAGGNFESFLCAQACFGADVVFGTMTRRKYATCVRALAIFADAGLVHRPLAALFAANTFRDLGPIRVPRQRQYDVHHLAVRALSFSACNACRGTYRTYFRDATAPFPRCPCLADVTGLAWEPA